jgi:hypothetical protein
MNSLLEAAASEFVKKVKENFLKKAGVKYKNYQIFHDEKLLLEIFNTSTFQTLMKDSADFVMEYDENYWAEHIMDEIEKIVDFDALKGK